jgi:hypothetical protein
MLRASDSLQSRCTRWPDRAAPTDLYPAWKNDKGGRKRKKFDQKEIRMKRDWWWRIIGEG